MAETVLVDTGFLAALVIRRDSNHAWAVAQLNRHPPPWQTCDAVLSESLYVIGSDALAPLSTLIRSKALDSSFRISDNADEVLKLMEKYASVPMSFADACLVRMTEMLPDPVLLTTDSDFQIYRRLGRKAVPCIMPG